MVNVAANGMCATAIMHQCTITGVISYILLSVCTSVKRDEKCTVFYGLGVERGGEEDRLSI